MSNIKIHIFHTGSVCVAPELPFGGGTVILLKHLVYWEKEERLWLPVS